MSRAWVSAGVQAAEAHRSLSLDRWPLYNDLRRFGDRWRKDSNCPDEAPIADDGPASLVERVHRWGRALADPFTRWFFGGALLAPVVHDAAILTWWRRAVSDADGGKAKPGRPMPVRLTRVAPVPGFSDDEQEAPPRTLAREAMPPGKLALPASQLALPAPRVLSAPAASTPSAAGAPRGVVPPAPPPAKPAEDAAFRLKAEERPVPWDVLKDLSGAALARVLAHNQRLGITEMLAAERAKGRVPHWTEYLTASERGDMDEGRLTEAQARALAAERGYPGEVPDKAAPSPY
mgnify:CR=1 FL=1